MKKYANGKLKHFEVLFSQLWHRVDLHMICFQAVLRVKAVLLSTCKELIFFEDYAHSVHADMKHYLHTL